MLKESRWGIDLHGENSHVKGNDYRRVVIYQPRQPYWDVQIAKVDEHEDADYEVRITGDDPDSPSDSTFVLFLKSKLMHAFADAMFTLQWNEKYQRNLEEEYEPADG
ncbi:MAG: hypothetical protein CL981_07760 [Euryarchaeota archaeon]|nr:hypothetical protein [Euryarchaeota archaeon]|tara:strand:- start:546 stop:866 length:321 start_codon:yes stop_codon:yes gene_type:complete